MSEDVLISREGRVGRLSLNRPNAIHALTHPMCGAMGAALLDWRSSSAVELVMIDHAEGRGFCAGGDIRALWESGRTDGTDARAFFREQYRLNHLLFTYPKPVVAFMDGITMGGGVGISLPARWRVVTERTSFAMPETGIGLFPDVGGGWYLSRLPGRIGAYLATTGARTDGADCLSLGIATHFVPSAVLPDLKSAIAAAPENLERLLDQASTHQPSAPITAQRAAVDRLFASDRYEDILRILEADGSDFAKTTLKTLAAKSPQAVKASLRLLAESGKLADFGHEMRMEYRIAARVCQRSDFIEGVRALIVDKTNDPRWNPAIPEDVSDALIETIFAPLPAADEWSPYPF